MAHKKGQGSVKNGRDSRSKRLGVKKFGGEAVIAGTIILRQVDCIVDLFDFRILDILDHLWR